jgi:hypothetical protein
MGGKRHGCFRAKISVSSRSFSLQDKGSKWLIGRSCQPALAFGVATVRNRGIEHCRRCSRVALSTLSRIGEHQPFPI